MLSLRWLSLLCIIAFEIHVQALVIQPADDNLLTIDLHSQTPLLLCTSSSNCSTHSWCNAGQCECEKGWITRCNSEPCSYQQRSKPVTLTISILLGVTGIHWFFLSRGDSLYIAVGILKCLILIASYVWRQLAMVSESKPAKQFAHSLSVTLGLIAIGSWLVDCVRLLIDSFPDGCGVPLLS